MFCTQCGSNIPKEQKFCTNCGERLSSEAFARPGSPQIRPEPAPSASSNATARPDSVAPPFPTPVQATVSPLIEQPPGAPTASAGTIASQPTTTLEAPRAPVQDSRSIETATPTLSKSLPANTVRASSVPIAPTAPVTRKGISTAIVAACAAILLVSAGAYFGIRKYNRSATVPQPSSSSSPASPPTPAPEPQVAQNQSPPPSTSGSGNPVSPPSGSPSNGSSQLGSAQIHPSPRPHATQPAPAITSTRVPASNAPVSAGNTPGTQPRAPQTWGFANPPSSSSGANPPATQPSTTAAPTAPPSPAVPVTPPSQQPASIEVPAETTVTVQTIDPIDSSMNHSGDQFRASLAEPIVVGNQVVVPKGADVHLRLSEVKSAGHISGKSELQIDLASIDYQGKSFPVVANLYDISGASRGKDSAKKIGVGAVIGGVIGGILGGGKGAAIGVGVGGGAGTAVQVATKGKQVRVPSETKIGFTLGQPVTISYVPTKP